MPKSHELLNKQEFNGAFLANHIMKSELKNIICQV